MKYKLTRTGNAPLVFDGEIIAESNGRVASGKEQNRWHDLRLYRTTGGNYVLEIAYISQWEGELGTSVAIQVSKESVLEELQMHDPIEYLQGFPRHEQYAEKQANLERWIVARYRAQVSDLLENVEELFETIE